MRTEPNFPHRPRNTDALIRSLIASVIILAIVMFFTSCAVSTAPDGTVTRSPDYNAIMDIIWLIKTDEVPPVAIPVPSK